MRLLERRSSSTDMSASAAFVAAKEAATATTTVLGHEHDSWRSTASTTTSANSTSKRSLFFFKAAPPTQETTTTTTASTLDTRRVRFSETNNNGNSEDDNEQRLLAILYHDSPYTEQDVETQWYSPQELQDMKMDCARQVAAILQDFSQQEIQHVLEACQTSARAVDEAQRLEILQRMVGIAHWCCKSYNRRDLQRNIVEAVQRAHQLDKSENDLCEAFLVYRASERTSLPCRRLARWFARAVQDDC